MGKRLPLSQAEKERLYTEKLKGRTLLELAKELDCSPQTVRKWWRRGREIGLAGLREPRIGRRAKGILSQFDALVAEKAEACKRHHPGWGADRVLIELRKDPQLQELALPKRSRLAAFFKARCPDCVTVYQPRPPNPPVASQGGA